MRTSQQIYVFTLAPKLSTLKNKEKALPKPLNSNALSFTIATLIIGRFWFCEVSVGYGVHVKNINFHLIQRRVEVRHNAVVLVGKNILYVVLFA
jgi:hypothetical protein